MIVLFLCPHCYFFRGNCTLVGSLGQPLELLASFALYIAGYTLHHLDTSTTIAFSEGMRALFRQAGLEGKPVAIILSVSQFGHFNVICSSAGELKVIDLYSVHIYHIRSNCVAF